VAGLVGGGLMGSGAPVPECVYSCACVCVFVCACVCVCVCARLCVVDYRIHACHRSRCPPPLRPQAMVDRQQRKVAAAARKEAKEAAELASALEVPPYSAFSSCLPSHPASLRLLPSFASRCLLSPLTFLRLPLPPFASCLPSPPAASLRLLPSIASRCLPSSAASLRLLPSLAYCLLSPAASLCLLPPLATCCRGRWCMRTLTPSRALQARSIAVATRAPVEGSGRAEASLGKGPRLDADGLVRRSGKHGHCRA